MRRPRRDSPASAQAERVLGLELSDGQVAVRAALSGAVEFGRFGHKDVAAILLAGGAAPSGRLQPGSAARAGRPAEVTRPGDGQPPVVGMRVRPLDPPPHL